MDFAQPRLLLMAVILTPLLAWFLIWSFGRQRSALSQFVRERLWPDLTVGVSSRRRILKRCLLTGALGSLLLALAQPRLGLGEEAAEASGRDIIVCVDVSRSMMATDAIPSRLARAKLACYDLISVAKSDRIGLVAFAGSAFLQCPLALDGEAFRQNVAALDPDSIPEPGTVIGDALDVALEGFGKDSVTRKAVILITDGEDHDEDAVAAAGRLSTAGVHLFTLGVGTPSGEILRSVDPYGNSVFLKDEGGNPVRSRLNSELLTEISAAARGFYLPLQTSKTMQELYDRGIKPMEATRFESSKVRARIERFQWPLGVGLMFLLIEFMVSEAIRPKIRGRRKGAKAGLSLGIAATVLLAVVPGALSAGTDEALKKYEQGEFKISREIYESEARRIPEDLRLPFNAGAAAYRDGDFKGAAGLFEQVLRAPELKLQQQGWFNLGNARFRGGEQEKDPAKKKEQWEQALASFSAAAKMDPNDLDARENADFVRQSIQSMPPPPQPSESSESKKSKDDSKEQNQKEKEKSEKSNSEDSKKDSSGDKSQEQEKAGADKTADGNKKGDSSEKSTEGEKEEGDDNQKDKQNEKEASKDSSGKGEKDKEKGGDGEQAQVGKDGTDKREREGNPGGEGKDDRKGTLMTVREAEKVLDAQKNQEKALLLRNRSGGSQEKGASAKRGRKPW